MVTKEGQENEEDYVTDHGYQETASSWMQVRWMQEGQVLKHAWARTSWCTYDDITP